VPPPWSENSCETRERSFPDKHSLAAARLAERLEAQAALARRVARDAVQRAVDQLAQLVVGELRARAVAHERQQVRP
jgi:hypothetical protein